MTTWDEMADTLAQIKELKKRKKDMATMLKAITNHSRMQINISIDGYIKKSEKSLGLETNSTFAHIFLTTLTDKIQYEIDQRERRLNEYQIVKKSDAKRG